MLLALALLLAIPSQVTITDSSGATAASVTAAGVSGSKALAVQGVTGGVAFDVSCIAGCSGGVSDVAATVGASEAAVNRSAVTAVIRVRDTTAGAGSQLVVAPGNTTDGIFVKLTNATVAVAGTQAAGSATIPNPVVIGGNDYGGTPKVQTAKVDSTGNVYVICASGCTPGGSFADNTAFSAGTTAINVSGGIFNDGLADVTSGNAAAPRITAKRAMHVNLRDTAGVELEGQKTMAGSVPVVIASDQTAITVATHAVTQGTSPWVVSGTVAATQSGAWTISVGGAFTDDTAASAAASEAATTRLAVNAALRLRDTTAGAGSQLVTWPGDATNGAFVQVKNTVTVTGTVAVSGTVAVTQSTSPWVVAGAAASGAAKSGNPVQIGGVFNTTQPTVTNGQAIEIQASARGEVLIAKGVSGFTIDNTTFASTQSGAWSITVVPSTASSANNTGTCTSVSVNATVLASFATRKGASIVAKATNTDRVFFKLGATATTAQPPLEAGQSFTLDGTGVYTGQIDAIANSGTQSVCAVEW